MEVERDNGGGGGWGSDDDDGDDSVEFASTAPKDRLGVDGVKSEVGVIGVVEEVGVDVEDDDGGRSNMGPKTEPSSSAR